jgi:hypothetical protein
MQGNAGDLMDLSSMMQRAIYDKDLVTEGSGDTAEDPLAS